MLQRNPPSPLQQAYNAFNDALIKGGHRSVIKDGRIYPDMEFILSMRDEFLRQCSPDEYKLKLKAADRYVTSISDVTAPIITTTQDASEVNTALLMTWQGNDPADYIRWLGIRESFKASGVPVVSCHTTSDRSVWIRDTNFVLGSTAFIPDPQRNCQLDYSMNVDGTIHVDQMSDNLVVDRVDEHAALLKKLGLDIVPMTGMYFEGADLMPDSQTNILFWGYNHFLYEDDQEQMATAVTRAMGQRIKIRPVKINSSAHPHLDLGISPQLPSGHFLIDGYIGHDDNDFNSGYCALHRVLRNERVITLPHHHCRKDLVTNLTVVGSTAFMTSCSADLRKRLEDLGNSVNAPEEQHYRTPSNYLYNPGILRHIGGHYGGGVHCVTKEIPLALAKKYLFSLE